LTTLLPVTSPSEISGTPLKAEVMPTISSGAEVAKRAERCRNDAALQAPAQGDADEALNENLAAHTGANAARGEQKKILHWITPAVLRRCPDADGALW